MIRHALEHSMMPPIIEFTDEAHPAARVLARSSIISRLTALRKLYAETQLGSDQRINLLAWQRENLKLEIDNLEQLLDLSDSELMTAYSDYTKNRKRSNSEKLTIRPQDFLAQLAVQLTILMGSSRPSDEVLGQLSDTCEEILDIISHYYEERDSADELLGVDVSQAKRDALAVELGLKDHTSQIDGIDMPAVKVDDYQPETRVNLPTQSSKVSVAENLSLHETPFFLDDERCLPEHLEAWVVGFLQSHNNKARIGFIARGIFEGQLLNSVEFEALRIALCNLVDENVVRKLEGGEYSLISKNRTALTTLKSVADLDEKIKAWKRSKTT